MAKLLAYPLSVIYYPFFVFTLILFDGVQRICLLFSADAHRHCIVVLNFLLLGCLNILGTRFFVDRPFHFEQNQSYIFVANHQSTYDIPPLIWYLRKIYPKFVGKKELGKGIPSISYNLRNGGAVLIDRKKPKQALQAIMDFGKKLSETNGSVVIFPEGTRSNSATPRAFRMGGLNQLAAVMPNAKFVGVSISNSWKLTRYGVFPMGIGAKMKLKFHPPIHLQKENIQASLEELEKTIVSGIEA